MTDRFCIECGASREPADAFCPECGVSHARPGTGPAAGASAAETAEARFDPAAVRRARELDPIVTSEPAEPEKYTPPWLEPPPVRAVPVTPEPGNADAVDAPRAGAASLKKPAGTDDLPVRAVRLTRPTPVPPADPVPADEPDGLRSAVEPEPELESLADDALEPDPEPEPPESVLVRALVPDQGPESVLVRAVVSEVPDPSAPAGADEDAPASGGAWLATHKPVAAGAAVLALVAIALLVMLVAGVFSTHHEVIYVRAPHR